MPRVITVQNIYTRKTYDVCQEHYDNRTESGPIIGDVQVSYGLHGDPGYRCDVCEKTRPTPRYRIDPGDEPEPEIGIPDPNKCFTCGGPGPFDVRGLCPSCTIETGTAR